MLNSVLLEYVSIISFPTTISLASEEYSVIISNKNVRMKIMCKLSFKQ